MKKLLEAWAKRPLQYNPEEVAHLMWVSTELLPALRDAMPVVEKIGTTKYCVWQFDSDTCSWDTMCGNKHLFIVDGPEKNNHKFCPYCGGALTIQIAPLPAPDSESPSTGQPSGPAPEPSSHSQGQIPNTGGTSEAPDQTAGTSDTPASLPAIQPDKLAALKAGAAKHGRSASTKKRAAAPRVKRQKTAATWQA